MTAAPPSSAPALSTVGLRVESDVRDELDRALRRRLQRRCHRMLAALGLAGAELSVLLAGDATMASLNQTWRNKKGTTDVLSFPQATPELIDAWRDNPLHASPDASPDASLHASPDASPDAPERVLGDLVISLDVVRHRSGAPDAFELDLVTLLAHGLLHLVGRDHSSAPNRRAMLALQDRLVAQARSRGPIRRIEDDA